MKQVIGMAGSWRAAAGPSLCTRRRRRRFVRHRNVDRTRIVPEDSMATAASPFRLHVPDSAIDDLRERLARTRFPDQAPGAPWAYGTDVTYLRELVAYWRDGFDWRAQEARLNALP